MDFRVYRTHLIVKSQKGELLKNTFPGNPDSRGLGWEQRILSRVTRCFLCLENFEKFKTRSVILTSDTLKERIYVKGETPN